MEVYQIIDEITSTQGTKAKIALIEKYAKNETFKNVLYLTYSRRVKFYIKQIPDYSNLNITSSYPLEQALIDLNKLSSRELTGHAGVEHLRKILNSVKMKDLSVIIKIIGKDLKLGTATTSINKAVPGLIEKEPYMGAIPYNEKDALALFQGGKEVYSDVKEDGRFQNTMIRGGEVEMTSRQGEVVYINNAKFAKELSFMPDMVLTGEVIVLGMPRYKSNGLINAISVIGRKKSEGLDTTKEELAFSQTEFMTVQEFADLIVYRVWDSLTIDEFFAKSSSVSLKLRRQDLFSKLRIAGVKSTQLVKYKVIKSLGEAKAHFAEELELGNEGTIIKAANAPWKDGKKKTSIKMKLEMNVDMKVTAFNYGTPGTKNEDVISAIQCESSDGKVKSVCAGIKEADMKYIEANQDELLGKIIDVKSCGLTTRDGKFALLHPVFIEFRTDKTEADSYGQIVLIENGIKGLQ